MTKCLPVPMKQLSLWRARADKARTMAKRCFAEGEKLLEIAAGYELLAEYAEHSDNAGGTDVSAG